MRDFERQSVPLAPLKPVEARIDEMLPQYEGMKNTLRRQKREMIEKMPWLEVKNGLLPPIDFKSTF